MWRDRAVILFGWASGGRRRSEISDADLKDLEASGENFIYRLPKSKTDQKGKGSTLPINGMASIALKDYPVIFGVKSHQIRDAVIGYTPRLVVRHSDRNALVGR